eukprot:9570019-Alexandrium_andersonii.AAC.1
MEYFFNDPQIAESSTSSDSPPPGLFRPSWSETAHCCAATRGAACPSTGGSTSELGGAIRRAP